MGENHQLEADAQQQEWQDEAVVAVGRWVAGMALCTCPTAMEHESCLILQMEVQ